MFPVFPVGLKYCEISWVMRFYTRAAKRGTLGTPTIHGAEVGTTGNNDWEHWGQTPLSRPCDTAIISLVGQRERLAVQILKRQVEVRRFRIGAADSLLCVGSQRRHRDSEQQREGRRSRS